MIREGKIPDLPKPYTAHLGQVVRAMLKQNVRQPNYSATSARAADLSLSLFPLAPQPKHRPNTAQIKALDNVKLQIRAIELRKA